jgi:porin
VLKQISGYLAFILLSHLSIQANEFSANIINDTSRLVSGGIDKTTAIRTLASISAEFSLNDNYTLYADVAMLRGDNGTLDTGAIQAYSNIDEDEFSKIYEVWIEGNYQDRSVRFKLGQIDANSEFAYVNHGAEFIHSSMGVSPSITFLATYPTPTFAGAFFWQPIENGTAAFAVFSDTTNEFEESFYIGEWTQVIDETIIKVGLWHQTGNIETLAADNIIDGTEGIYATAEGELSMQFLSSQSAGWLAS